MRRRPLMEAARRTSTEIDDLDCTDGSTDTSRKGLRAAADSDRSSAIRHLLDVPNISFVEIVEKVADCGLETATRRSFLEVSWNGPLDG